METHKVLVIEDEPLLALDLETHLLDLGQDVVGIASDAKQAMAIAERDPPDFAFLDVNLLDGPSGPRIARMLSDKYQTVVVFVTGSREQIPEDFAGALGAIDKPCGRPTLEHVFRFLIDYRRDRRISGLPRNMTPAPALAFQARM